MLPRWQPTSYSAATCKNATSNDTGVRKLHDGDGLYLWVYRDGRKYWRFRYWEAGKEKSLDAREVKTKFSKTFTTYFFPIDGDTRKIFEEWVQSLRDEKFWNNDDPLFPATRVTIGKSGEFEVDGFDKKHWSNATPIRKILREAFENASLPYFTPHSFRHALVRLGECLCNTPEEFKAWSQNLGHEAVLTTFFSYGEVGEHRQGEIIQNLTVKKPVDLMNVEAIAEAVARKIKRY